jgi:hypothetical protein
MADPPSLLDHLDTLYPLACMLAGRDAAPDLLQRTAEEASRRPVSEHPSSVEDWMRSLVRTYERNSSSTGDEPPVSSSTVPDSMHTEAARQVLREALPTALAACSPQERFLLALDLLGTADVPTDSFLSSLQPSEAHAALRTEIRDLLSDRETALIEESLPDDALRKTTEELLSERYASVPSPLRTRLQATLETASPPTDTTDTEPGPSLLDRLPSRPTPRGLLFLFFVGVLVLGGGIAASYLFPAASTTSSSALSLTAFSAQHSRAVTPELNTRSRAKAEAYVDSVWNRRLAVPSIDGVPLRGVGRLRVGDGADIPALLYGSEGAQITTFAYNYAIVQQIENEVSLSANVRRALAEKRAVVAEPAVSDPVLLWRHRDDIFVAVAPKMSADSLRARLRRPH